MEPLPTSTLLERAGGGLVKTCERNNRFFRAPAVDGIPIEPYEGCMRQVAKHMLVVGASVLMFIAFVWTTAARETFFAGLALSLVVVLARKSP